MKFYAVPKCQVSVYCDSGSSVIFLAVFIRLARVSSFTSSFKNKLKRKVAQTSNVQEMLEYPVA